MITELYKEKERLQKITAYSHDDRIVLLANKKPSIKKGGKGYVPPLNLGEDWKNQPCVEINRDKNGEMVLVNYYTKNLLGYPDKTVEDFYHANKRSYPKTLPVHKILIKLKGRWEGEPLYVSKAQYESFSPHKQKVFRPIYEKAIDLGEGIKAVAKANYLYLNITCLPETFMSRYRLALEQMMTLYDKNILGYNGKAREERKIKEAQRYHLRRKWAVKQYEHNILLVGKIGKAVFDDLKVHDIGDSSGKRYLTTSYLKSGKQSQMWIKCYNVTAKDEKREGNRNTDLYKIEITFRGPFFKAKGMKDINNFTVQPQIQEILSEWIKEKVLWVFKKLSFGTKAMLKREYQTKNQNELLARIIDKSRTKTQIMANLKKVNNDIKKLEKKSTVIKKPPLSIKLSFCSPDYIFIEEPRIKGAVV